MTTSTRPGWPVDLEARWRAGESLADLLPDDDGEKMPSLVHFIGLALLHETLRRWLAGRRVCFIGIDMFVYFYPEPEPPSYRGPDFFVVCDVADYPRRSWILREEGGRSLDVVIEMLSPGTARVDRGPKKEVYQDRLKVPEYYWFNPETAEFRGFRLVNGVYEEMTPDAAGKLPCDMLGLDLVVWEGEYDGYYRHWLRWVTRDGALLLTGDESKAEAEAAQAQAEAAKAEAEAAQAQAEAAKTEVEVRLQAAEAEIERLRRLLDAREQV